MDRGLQYTGGIMKSSGAYKRERSTYNNKKSKGGLEIKSKSRMDRRLLSEKKKSAGVQAAGVR